MTNIIIDTDILVHIYRTTIDRSIGSSSRYMNEPHPGTNKTIEGWNWDKRYWPTTREFEAASLSPSIWDPQSSGINKKDLQSGYGDNLDLKLINIENILTTEIDIWAPKLNHGYYYIDDEEWYLFSDSFLTEYFTSTGLDINSNQILQLTHNYKPTIPIQIRRWSFDTFLGKQTIDKKFRKVIEFSTTNDPEFKLDLTTQPPTIILDDDYTEVVGASITTISGITDPATISGLELLAISDGLANFEVLANFSPFDPDKDIEVWTWTDPSFPISWSGISPNQEFDQAAINQVQIDRDRGAIRFGNYNCITNTGGGKIPAQGNRIGIYYTKGLAVQYEPTKSKDSILAFQSGADINPVTASVSNGFIHIATESTEAATITLTSTLPKINPYLIELGNNIGELIAIVKTATGVLLEGQEVLFEILEPIVGTFGTNSKIVSAITNSDGEARTFYNSPLVVEDLGSTTIDVIQDSGTTIVEVDGIIEPDTLSEIYLYKIHKEDEVLGIASGVENIYYQNYLTEIEALVGDPSTIDFEKDFRTTNLISKPTLYPNSDLMIGKKSMILTQKGGVMNPHTGLYDSLALSPLYPTSIVDIGTTTLPVLKMTYSGLLETPGTGDTKSYFAIGNANTNLQASITNKRTGKVLNSNIIEMKVEIPDTLNGTFYCDTLNNIPIGLLSKTKNVDLIPDININSTSAIEDFYNDFLSERLTISESYLDWFRRTRRGDTIGLTLAEIQLSDPVLSGLDIVDPIDCPAEIPLGFRLKSTGITIGSILDQVTFLDVNDHLASGYFK